MNGLESLQKFMIVNQLINASTSVKTVDSDRTNIPL
jgi:hypothetical protein